MKIPRATPTDTPYKTLKVLNFCWMGVGNYICNYLGYFGATVVRVESAATPDPLRGFPPFARARETDECPLERSAYFANTHPAKEYGLSLDLKNPKAGAVLDRLVDWADVVCTAFPTSTLERLGLSYGQLKTLKHDIIVMNTNGFGTTGSLKDQVSTGLTSMALSGTAELAGWADRPSVPINSYYTDQLAPLLGGLALVAAVDHRRRTGEGQFIDQAQIESGISFITPLVLDYTVNGRTLDRNGNRRIDAAPNGAYRCKGDDRWVAIGIQNDTEWRIFCGASRHPEWINDPRFASLPARVANADELDRVINEWTLDYTPEHIMMLLQGLGVGAGAVSTGQEQAEDPQLKHYNFFQEFDHRHMGKLNFYHPPGFRLSDAEARVCAPVMLGEHSKEVCESFLGISRDEFETLRIDGVFN